MPKIIENENERKLSTAITLSREIKERLDAKLRVTKPRITRSALIEHLIEEWLESSY